MAQELLIKIGADIKELQASLRSAQGELAKFSASASKQAQSAAAALDRAGGSAQAAAGRAAQRGTEDLDKVTAKAGGVASSLGGHVEDMAAQMIKAARQVKAATASIAESSAKVQQALAAAQKQPQGPATPGQAPTPQPRAPRAPAPAPAPSAPDPAADAKKRTQDIARALPQITDIATSLAGGMSPLTVLLQQGGQLRDIFGGVGAALRAVGTALASIVNPFTVAAAAVAGLAFAYNKATSESQEFRRIAILTGRAAGESAQGYSDLADELARLVDGATVGSSAETLLKIAESGKFAGAQIAQVAKSAEILKQTAGQDVEATIAAFAKIKDDPVQGTLELNRAFNLLDGTTLKTIRDLQNQGRSTEATKLAFDTYANAIAQRGPELVANLGIVERAWRGIKVGARRVADDLLGIFRASDREKFEKQLVIAEEFDQLAANAESENDKKRFRERAARARAEAAKLQDANAAAQKQASQDGARVIANQGEAALTAEAQATESQAQQRVRLRQQIEARSASAIAQARIAGEGQIEELVAAAREKLNAKIGREEAGVSSAILSSRAQTVRAIADNTIAELDDLYRRSEVSTDAYLKAKVELQTAAIDAELKAARVAQGAANEPQEQAAALERVKQLEAERQRIVVDSVNFRRDKEKELADQLKAIQADLLESKGDLGDAEKLRFMVQFADLRKRLVAEGQGEGLKILDELGAERQRKVAEQLADQVVEIRAQLLEREGKLEEAAILRSSVQLREFYRQMGKDAEAAQLGVKLVNADAARAKLAEIQAGMQAIQERLTTDLSNIEAGTASGALTPEASTAAAEEARQRALRGLQELQAQAAALAESFKDPEIASSAQRLAQAINGIKKDNLKGVSGAMAELSLSLAQAQENFTSGVVMAGVNSLGNALASLATQQKSVGSAARDMARAFAAAVAQMAAQVLAQYATLSLMRAFGMSVGGVDAGTGAGTVGVGAYGSGVFHGGGRVFGGGRSNRRVSPLVFAGAPRYHGGGKIPGLKAGEVPAILKAGERVLTPEQDAQRMAGGNTKIVNAIDPALIADHLDSAAGERVILNVIGRNGVQVRNIVQAG